MYTYKERYLIVFNIWGEEISMTYIMDNRVPYFDIDPEEIPPRIIMER